MVVTEGLVEEFIDGFPALSPADPYDTRPIQVVDDCSVLVALAVGDFINANRLKIPNPVPIAQPPDGTVKLVREGRFRDTQDLCGSFLRH